MLVGDQIRKLRLKKGFSQQFLADSIGISQSKFNRIENGKTEISINSLSVVCQLLDTTLQEFIATVDDKCHTSAPKDYNTIDNSVFEKEIKTLNNEIKDLKNQVIEMAQLIREKRS